ncbi:unnamed protein product [Chrysoparadoxa australica]
MSSKKAAGGSAASKRSGRSSQPMPVWKLYPGHEDDSDEENYVEPSPLDVTNPMVPVEMSPMNENSAGTSHSNFVPSSWSSDTFGRDVTPPISPPAGSKVGMGSRIKGMFKNRSSGSTKASRSMAGTEKGGVDHIMGRLAKKNDVKAGPDLWRPCDKRPVPRMQEYLTVAVLALFGFIVSGWVWGVVTEVQDTGSYAPLAILLLLPAVFTWVLFSLYVLVSVILNTFGPLSALKSNSTFYSFIRSTTPKYLPKVTIQMPVYKEDLLGTILPSIKSLLAAMEYYKSYGGESSIFINDDGLQLISEQDRQDRIDTYNKLNIAYVARPPNDIKIRRGRFKKASNMNYSLNISKKVEMMLAQYKDLDPEEALNQVKTYYKDEFLAGGNLLMGEIILLIDSDTRVPVDCLLAVQGEFAQDASVGFLQCRTTPLMICIDNYFERFLGFFTKIIYDFGIATTCAWGTIAPLVGHNAFLRWDVMKELSWFDSEDQIQKFWSEAHVSEDFDMSLRMFSSGYIGRYITYTGPSFKEGVSLTVHDEIIKLKKFGFGACEMIFNPFKHWITKGIFTKLWITFFKVREVPWYSKVGLLSYLGTYLAMGAALPMITIWYIVITFSKKEVISNSFYMPDPFSISITVNAIFGFFGMLFTLPCPSHHLNHHHHAQELRNIAFAQCKPVVRFYSYFCTPHHISGTIGLIFWSYRMRDVFYITEEAEARAKEFTGTDQFAWPIVTTARDTIYAGIVSAIFFSGLTYHMTVACATYFLCLDLSWGSTLKELDEDAGFLKEVKMILERYWLMFTIYAVMTVIWLLGVLLPQYSGWDQYTNLQVLFPWLNHMVPMLASVFLLSPACIKLFY